MKRTWLLISSAALTLACGGSPSQQRPASTADRTPATPTAKPLTDLEQAPPPGVTPEAKFPQIHHDALDNGLKLRVVKRGEIPIVELRLVIFSGQATDGDKAGVATVAGELLKAGGAGAFRSRELVERAEALGGRLEVLTDRDATTVSLSVSARDLERGLELIGAVAQKPRFDPVEFTKLKQRELERVTSLARTSPGWVASMVLYRELFELPSAVHPYAQYDATPASLGRITLADCRAWHQQHFVPSNATLVVAGYSTPAEVKAAAQRVFAGWRGAAPSRPSFATPLPPNQTRLYVVNRPRSPQAQIYVATLGPERKSPDWAALKTANQILGGGVSGRLFLDVREQRSLAYSTGSSVEELARGPVPLLLSAGTQTAKAGLAVQGLLEHAEKIRSAPPTPKEVATATRYLSDSFLIASETTAAIASMTARLAVFGLPDDYYDEYRAQVRQTTGPDVAQVAARYFRSGSHLIVVAGDAERITQPLSRFGAVNVVEPEQGFTTVRIVPQDASAPLAPQAGPAPDQRQRE